MYSIDTQTRVRFVFVFLYMYIVCIDRDKRFKATPAIYLPGFSPVGVQAH